MLLRLTAWLVIPQAAVLQCVGISPSTWRRRVQAGCLSVQESDRLYRFVSALDLAIQRFDGNKADAYAWLRRPQRGLANHCAIDLLTTSVGTEAIRELAGRLEHGVTP
jgi:putative toxin-antitoxin system antitoxin component (TIGR02293 family)